MSQVLMRAAVVMSIIALACSVNRRTPSLACATTNDCKNGGTCESGYCVGEGSGGCPSQCKSCENSTNPPTCMMVGSGGGSLSCPSGFQCTIDCASGGACGSITCGSSGCDISCTGTDACGSISCGSGPCTVSCTGSPACGSIKCDNSCACDVMCLTGQCGTNTCPSHRQGQNTINCTNTGATGTGTTCSSSDQPGCNSC